MSEPAEGLLLLDKPPGPTSHDIVDLVRRVTGQRRVGHAGTLDPMASGLLPVVLGRATRLVRFLPSSPKVYEGTLRLGVTTSTDDTTGEILETFEGALPSAERVIAAARRFEGRIMQVPPAFSAKKVEGTRLYRLARRHDAVAARATEVEVTRFDLRPAGPEGEWAFRTEVSAGTYVRALARDLGAFLGCGGTLSSLRRLAIGPLRVEAAIPLAAAPGGNPGPVLSAIIPLDEIPIEPPPVALTGDGLSDRFLSGNTVPAPPGSPASGYCKVLDSGGRLIGVAESADGRLHPRVVVGCRVLP